MDELCYELGPISLKKAKVDGETKYALVMEKPASREEFDLLSGESMKHLFSRAKGAILVDGGKPGTTNYVYEGKEQRVLMSFEEVKVGDKLYKCFLRNGKVDGVNLMHVRVFNELEEAGSALEEIYSEEEGEF